MSSGQLPSALQAGGGAGHGDERAGGGDGDSRRATPRTAGTVCPGCEKTSGSISLDDAVRYQRGGL